MNLQNQIGIRHFVSFVGWCAWVHVHLLHVLEVDSSANLDKAVRNVDLRRAVVLGRAEPVELVRHADLPDLFIDGDQVPDSPLVVMEVTDVDQVLPRIGASWLHRRGCRRHVASLLEVLGISQLDGCRVHAQLLAKEERIFAWVLLGFWVFEKILGDQRHLFQYSHAGAHRRG